MTTPTEKDLAGTKDAANDVRSLKEPTTRFDGLLAKLQTPEARAGLLAAINATPQELGEFAVRAATTAEAEKKV
jgi:antitoxin Phd